MMLTETEITKRLQEAFRRLNYLTSTEENTALRGRLLEKRITETEVRAELLCEILDLDVAEEYRRFNG